MSKEKLQSIIKEILRHPISRIFCNSSCSYGNIKNGSIELKTTLFDVKKKIESNEITEINDLRDAINSLVNEVSETYKENEFISSIIDEFRKILLKIFAKHRLQKDWCNRILDIRNVIHDSLYNPPISLYPGSGINLDKDITSQVINEKSGKLMILANQMLSERCYQEEIATIISDLQPDLIEKGSTLVLDLTKIKPPTFTALQKKMTELLNEQGKEYPTELPVPQTPTKSEKSNQQQNNSEAQ